MDMSIRVNSDLEKKINEILKRCPLLNAHGYGLPDGGDIEELRKEQEELFYCADEFEVSFGFLDTVKPAAAIYRDRTSYGIKAEAEAHSRNMGLDYTYTCNGVFIVAALIRGFAIEPRNGSINVFMNISRKRN